MGACGADPTFMVDWQDEGGAICILQLIIIHSAAWRRTLPVLAAGTFVCYKE